MRTGGLGPLEPPGRLTGRSNSRGRALRFQLSGVRVLQVEPRHLNLLFGTVARHVCLVPDLLVVCRIDHAQFAPDNLALRVDKPLPSHLRTQYVLLRRAVTVRYPRGVHARREVVRRLGWDSESRS